jgi:hypothetical protein
MVDADELALLCVGFAATMQSFLGEPFMADDQAEVNLSP